MISSSVRLRYAATVGAAALLSLQGAARAAPQKQEPPKAKAAACLVPRVEVIFGYTLGHLSTVFSSPVLQPARQRALTQREDAVFRRALLNSLKIVSAGRLVAR